MTSALIERPLGPPMSEPPTTEQISEDELVLVAVPSAISCAQLLVRAVARDWRLDRFCADIANDAVSELVAHTVATTGATDPGPTYHTEFDRVGLMTVRVRLIPRSLVVEVWDNGDSAPEPPLVTFRKGIDDWGYHMPYPGQRVVWCKLAVRTGGIDNTMRLPAILPRRERRNFPRPDQPIKPMRDPHLLQRVLEGLRSLDQSAKEEK